MPIPYRYAIFFLLLAGLLTSCSMERNLARDYVKNHKGEGIMLSPVNFLYKENTGAYIDTSKYPLSSQQDSVAYYSSSYMQFISDSIFLTVFTNSLIDALSDEGFDVTLDESADLFLGSRKPTWILQISQLQLEEDFTPRVVYAYDDEDVEYFQEYRQNLIGLNSWLEVSRLNAENSKKQLLFLSGYIEDDANQGVSLEYYEGEFYFRAARDTIQISDIYRMASSSARKHAELLFDYFMNDYIRLNLHNTTGIRKEMHYDRKLNRIESGLRERFELAR